jgi:hypothetical protein
VVSSYIGPMHASAKSTDADRTTKLNLARSVGFSLVEPFPMHVKSVNVYVVGPRPMYPRRRNVRMDGSIIVSAPPDTEARVAREKALKLSKELAALGYAKISAHAISAAEVPDFERRGARDRRE